MHTTVATTRAKRLLSAFCDGGRLQRRSSQILHAGELLPPVGEVAEGVGTREVGGGGSQLQREDVVHHLAQTNVAGRAQGQTTRRDVNLQTIDSSVNMKRYKQVFSSNV